MQLVYSDNLNDIHMIMLIKIKSINNWLKTRMGEFIKIQTNIGQIHWNK